MNDQDLATTNDLGEQLSSDPVVLQAVVDNVSNAFEVERSVRDGLLAILGTLVPSDVFADIVAQSKAYTEACYAMIGADHLKRTGQDLFRGDPNPTGL
jgi:hypothetical protein